MTDVLSRVIDATDAGVGGGSASALAGAMAAGLVGMVARLSTTRGLALDDAQYEAIADEADALGAALLAGADEDAAAYALIRAAYRLPRADASQAAVREAAIHDAFVAASQVPLGNARRAQRVLELAAVLRDRSNAAAASDLVVARLLAGTAVSGCLANVDVNLESLPESATAELRRQTEVVRTAYVRAGAPKETA